MVTIGGSGVAFRNVTVSGAAANGVVLSSTSGVFQISGTTNLGTAGGTGPTGIAINIVNYPSGTISFGPININRRGNTGIFIDNFDGSTGSSAQRLFQIKTQRAATAYASRIQRCPHLRQRHNQRLQHGRRAKRRRLEWRPGQRRRRRRHLPDQQHRQLYAERRHTFKLRQRLHRSAHRLESCPLRRQHHKSGCRHGIWGSNRAMAVTASGHTISPARAASPAELSPTGTRATATE